MIENRLEVWKNIVEAQKHFNGLIITVRERAITVLGAGLVAAAFLAKDNYVLKQPIRASHIALIALIISIFFIIYWLNYSIDRLINKFRREKTIYNKKPTNVFWVVILSFGIAISIYLYAKNIHYIQNSLLATPVLTNPGLAGVTTIALAFVWLVFYVMDRFWYHRLLKASVEANIRIETDLMIEITPAKDESKEADTPIPYPGLGVSISANSPVRPWGLPLEFNSDAKIDFFYSTIFIALVITGTLLLKSSEIFQQQASIDNDKKIAIYKESRYRDSILIRTLNQRVEKLEKVK